MHVHIWCCIFTGYIFFPTAMPMGRDGVHGLYKPAFDSAVCAYCVIVQFSFQETAGAGAGRPEEARARPERRAHWDHWALGAVTFNGLHNVQWQWKLFVGFAF